MDDYIYQRLGFFRPLLFQENYVETLRSELQMHLRNMGGELLSSAKVRLCGSWAAKLSTRVSDVNFTVLLPPKSLFAMLDAKKWSLSGVELEEFRQAALKRREMLQAAERELNVALEGKKKACKAIAEWEEGIPSDKAHGRKSTPDRAYSYRRSSDTKTHRRYKFHDGVDYRFFIDRVAPEMPAEVFLAKRANPLERSVRQKLTSTPKDTDAATVMQDDQGEEGEAEDIDWESDAEPIDPQALDMTMAPVQGAEPCLTAVSAPATVSPATTEMTAQTMAGGDGGGKGDGGPGGEKQDLPDSVDGHRDGQTPEWQTSIEDAFKTYDAREAQDLGNELDPASQSRLHDEWTRGTFCVEGGKEMDMIKLLQPTGADVLDREAYNLKVQYAHSMDLT
eukprot:g5335.t1